MTTNTILCAGKNKNGTHCDKPAEVGSCFCNTHHHGIAIETVNTTTRMMCAYSQCYEPSAANSHFCKEHTVSKPRNMKSGNTGFSFFGNSRHK